jgi:hypothetical protein
MKTSLELNFLQAGSVTAPGGFMVLKAARRDLYWNICCY